MSAAFINFETMSRKSIEASISALIDYLDIVDGDADMEPIDEREVDHDFEDEKEGAC